MFTPYLPVYDGEIVNEEMYCSLDSSSREIVFGETVYPESIQLHNGDFTVTIPTGSFVGHNDRIGGCIIGICPGSEFGRVFRTALFLPSQQDENESHPSRFQLIQGLDDPSSYCLDGSYGLAQMRVYTSRSADTRRTIQIRAAVTLIAPAGERSGEIMIADAPQIGPTNFLVKFGDYPDRLPYDFRVVLGEYIMAARRPYRGIDMSAVNLAEIFEHLPSIQYTIYESQDSNTIAATVILGPEDYASVDSHGFINTHIENVESIHDRVPSLGMNFLQRSGVFIDYINNRIGFCEPI